VINFQHCSVCSWLRSLPEDEQSALEVLFYRLDKNDSVVSSVVSTQYHKEFSRRTVCNHRRKCMDIHRKEGEPKKKTYDYSLEDLIIVGRRQGYEGGRQKKRNPNLNDDKLTKLFEEHS